jgi:hypothetical protein
VQLTYPDDYYAAGTCDRNLMLDRMVFDPPTACTPTTCAAQGKNCGSISDGCGGTLSCGSCTSPQTCGGGASANVCGAASTAAYPPDQIGLSAVPVKSMPMPAYLQPTVDPTFGDVVTRVSDQAAFGTTNQLLSHQYAKVQVWNADESLIMLSGQNNNTSYLLDGKTGAYLRTVHEPGELLAPRWSNVNPNNRYVVLHSTISGCNNSNQFAVWHPLTDTSSTPTFTVVHTFSQFDGCANMSFGLEEGNFSNDDSVGAVIGFSQSRSSWGVTSFRMTNVNTSLPSVTEIATHWLGSEGGTTSNWIASAWNNVGVTPKGDGVVLQWNAVGSALNQGIEWHSLDFSTTKHIADNGGTHFDLGLDGNGNEMLVYVAHGYGAVGSPFIAAAPLNAQGPAGVPINLLTVSSSPMSTQVHVSCRNQFKRPGWCYVSDGGNVPTLPVGYQQMYALKLDASQTVEVYGVDHASDVQSCTSCKTNQFTARAVPSHDGTRLLFASDWGGGASAPTYDYLLRWR